jgi:hypothetical protein
MYTSLARGGGAVIPPSATVGSYRCAWPDYGRPSIHITFGIDPGSTTIVYLPATAGRISILDVRARFMGLAVADQLLQHDDASDTTLTYGVGR